MNKKLLVLIALTVIIAPLSAEWVYLDRAGAQNSSPVIKIVVSDEQHIVVEVTLPGFNRDLDRGLWKIDIPGSASTESLGKSALPVVSGLVSIPANVAKVKITDYQVLSTVDYEGMQAYPFQKPTTDDDKAVFSKDQAHYLSSELFPLNCLTLDNIAVWRNQKVVAFRLVPMQVRAADGLVSVHNKVRFVLSYEKGRNELPRVSETEAFEAMYRRMLLNYTPHEVSRSRGKYLVIAEDSLIEAIQPLVDWRKGQGYDVSVKKLGKVGTTPQTIKDYLSGEYGKGLAYVLLVGDPDKLPLYKWDNRYPSDYWYSCLSGDDMYADVALGRICAKNAAEVDIYIRKIKAYESYKGNGNDWTTKALLISHKQGAPGKYEGCLEELRKKKYSYKINFMTRHGSKSSSTNSAVKNDIDAGVAIVNYRGHGSTDSWSHWNGSSFTTSNMKSLNNSVYPVFYSIACYNCQLDSYKETLAESCLKNPNGGGCAFLGASRPSYTTPNHDFCKFLFAGSFNEGMTTIGDVSNYGNMKLLKKFGPSSYAATNVKMYLWLGDPATKLHVVK